MKKNVLISALLCGIATIFLLCGCSSAKIKANSSANLPMDGSIVQGQLENGMSYFIKSNGEPKNRIVLRLVVKAGSNMEDDDQKGVAHFVEHLAFNGTKNFEKSAIVDYFEKIGMDFGSDLNAYTSFDQTVYKLEIPADNPEMLKTAVLILHDWACGITFPQEEIDKERGVVTEEWRLRQGLQGRVSDTLLPFLLKDSRYKDRLPIGDMDVIANISRDRILDFYNKWYRPEFMSMVVVGDADVEVLKQAVIEGMSEVPARDDKLELPKYTVPVQSGKNVCLFKDVEQKYTVVEILKRDESFAPATTEDDIRSALALQIASEILNDRLNEISLTADAKWYEAFADGLHYTNSTYFGVLGFVPKAGMFSECFKAFIDEYERFVKFGATESEVTRAKEAILVGLEQSYKNRDKIKSSTHADNIVSYVLGGGVVTSEEYDYELYNRIVPEITLAEINGEFNKKYADRGDLLFFEAPVNANDEEVDNLTEDGLKALWVEYSGSELSAYEDDVNDDPLLEKPLNSGKIVSEKLIPELDVKEFIFDNGVRVLTKKTDFVENQISMMAYSKGGLYAVKENDVPSAKYSVNYKYQSGFNGLNINQFNKKISTKNVSFDIDVGTVNETITGSATNEDFEVLMQIVNLLFTDGQFTDDAWTVLIENLTETAKKHGLQPRDLFLDKIIETIYGNDIAFAPLDMNYVAKLDKAKAEKMYKQRYENAADFTFIFVGDFDEENLLKQFGSYVGSLKTSKERETYSYKKHEFPKGITTKTVCKGLDEQGQVFIGFGGVAGPCTDVEQRYYEAFMASELCSLLNIRLREAIREDKSGSYGIGAFGGLDNNTERSYLFEIDFGCQPDRAEELTAEVIRQLEIIKNEPVSQDYLEKLKETLKRGRETNLRNNSWWITRIRQELFEEVEPLWVSQDINKIADWVTAEALQEQAKKYLDTSNYCVVYLKPEK